MFKELFDTPQKIETALSNFKTLKGHPGWLMVVEIFETNIKVLEDQLLNGYPDETKEEIDRKRDKLKAYKEVLECPDYWTAKFESPAPFKEENDPYHTVTSLRESRKGDYGVH
jgi:hypothetical protein